MIYQKDALYRFINRCQITKFVVKGISVISDLRSLMLIILLIIASIRVASQSLEFVAVYGNSTYNEGVGTFQLDDSTYLIIGNSSGFSTNSAIYLAYIDQYGSLIKDLLIQKPFLIKVTSAAFKDNRIYLAGYATQQGTYRNMLLITDIHGNLMKEKYWGSGGWNFARALVISENGNIHVAGEATDTIYGVKQASLSCLDTSGVLQWQKSFGGQLDDVFLAIDTGHNNSLIMAGYSESYSIYGDSALYIINTDYNGNVNWEIVEDYAGPDIATGIRPDLSGGYILCGQSAFWVDYGLESFILRLDSSGGVEWKNRLGSEDEAAFYSIIQMPDSTYRMAGYWTKGQHGFGKRDFFMQNADPDGWWSQYLPAQIFGGDEDDIAVHLILTSEKGYIMTGTTKSFGSGSTHIMIIKTDSTGSIGPNIGLQTSIGSMPSSNKKDLYLLYPNPANDEIFIRSLNYNKQPLIDYKIRDISGRVLRSANMSVPENGIEKLNISDLPVGIYFFSADNQTIKFIRQ